MQCYQEIDFATRQRQTFQCCCCCSEVRRRWIAQEAALDVPTHNPSCFNCSIRFSRSLLSSAQCDMNQILMLRVLPYCSSKRLSGASGQSKGIRGKTETINNLVRTLSLLTPSEVIQDFQEIAKSLQQGQRQMKQPCWGSPVRALLGTNQASSRVGKSA